MGPFAKTQREREREREREIWRERERERDGESSASRMNYRLTGRAHTTECFVHKSGILFIDLMKQIVMKRRHHHHPSQYLEDVVRVEQYGDDSGRGGGEERERVAVHEEPGGRPPFDELVGHVDAASGAILDHEQAQ